MARALTFKLTKTLDWTYTNAVDLSTPTDAKTLSLIDTNLTSGTGKDKADRLWHDTRTLTATTSEKIDMYDLAIDGGAAGEDSLGQTVAAAVVKSITIRNKNTTAGNDLKVFGEGSAAAWNSPMDGSDTAKVVIGPGGSLTLEAPAAAGYAVADTSNHLLKIDNPGASSITYDIIVVFATAAS